MSHLARSDGGVPKAAVDRVEVGYSGGITNAVIGGHAMGANYETTGVVTLGDFTAAAAPQPMVNAISDLVGWKLYVHGTDPNGTNTYHHPERFRFDDERSPVS